ncbi:MAG: transporter substrate-binding domain-containing protein [Oscillospiraceae bacterium]|jgi:L-cystine transport system substrate-binding protein|nr:transporter substrate-binding domain-containing protein [Oscillospiraceae bacterium]
MKRIAAILLTAGLLFGLSACGGGTDDGNSVRTVVVGTSNDYPPYCYLDGNGDLVGFEKELLDAVDARLPQYKFKYEIYDFKNILTALDTGRVDIAAHQYGTNPEREEKYLFGTVPYFSTEDFIVVAAGTEGIASLDDLAGKIVSVAPACNWALMLEDYNAAHPETPIQIEYYESTPQILSSNLENGVIDATVMTTADVQLMNTLLGTSFKTVGAPLSDTEVFHIYAKDETQLQADIDTVLQELKDSGEMERLSQAALDSVIKNNKELG